MKNNTTIEIIIGIIALAGVLIYLGGRNKSSVPPNTAIDHSHNTSANLSLTSLNNLVGKPAPEYSFADMNGQIYSSENLRGKNIILFFNEGLMCYPACWNQIAALAGDGHFKDGDTVVLSVVVDSPEQWQKAVEKMPELAKATVVFDKGAAVSKKFGVLTTASSMHYGSLPGHTYAIIDKEGLVRHMFDDPNMSIHNDQLVAEIEKLSQDSAGKE